MSHGWARRIDDGKDIRKIQPVWGEKPPSSSETKQKAIRAVRGILLEYSIKSLVYKSRIRYMVNTNGLVEKGFSFGVGSLFKNLKLEKGQIRVHF